MKKSIVKKSICRKIQTKKFEQVDINLEILEEIEWKTAQERMKKTDQVTQILLLDFVQTYNKVLGELNVDRQLATGSRPAHSETTSNDSKASADFDFLGE